MDLKRHFILAALVLGSTAAAAVEGPTVLTSHTLMNGQTLSITPKGYSVVSSAYDSTLRVGGCPQFIDNIVQEEEGVTNLIKKMAQVYNTAAPNLVAPFLADMQTTLMAHTIGVIACQNTPNKTAPKNVSAALIALDRMQTMTSEMLHGLKTPAP